MLWAIDVGNTQTVVGLHDGSGWKHVWRVQTQREGTADEFGAAMHSLCSLSGVAFEAEGVVAASVVPTLDRTLERFAQRWLNAPIRMLNSGEEVGLPVDYSPEHAVGADRIANAIAALEISDPPVVVVDFGTATTIDCVDATGCYAGGAILAGVDVSASALAAHTAKLPEIDLRAPGTVIGKTTRHSLQSGIVLGHAGAVNSLVQRTVEELGGTAKVIGTGGHCEVFRDLCPSIDLIEPNLTLDGLVIAWHRLGLS